MLEDKKPDTKPIINHVIRQLNDLAYEMRDDRNDGWVKKHYANALLEVYMHTKKLLDR